jgi:hypothetical protein
MRRMWSIALLGLAACAFDAAGVDDANPVGGAWVYQASQVVPIPTTLEGTMLLSGALASSVRGEFTGLEREATGGAVQVVATISGRVASGSTVDLLMSRGQEQRRHIGALRGDSIVGTWSTAEVPVVSGQFVMRRP